MSDEDALLAAIDANLDEDTPRLVYADWLDEHGQAIRAEFIRVQVEVARVETLPRILLNRHVDLFRRQQELLDNHRAELLGPLAELPARTRIDFHRGFVTELELPVGVFLDHGIALDQARPRPAVRVLRVGRRLNDFLRSGHLGCVTHVSMYTTFPAGHEFLLPDPAATQRAIPRLSRLQSLDLEGCEIGDTTLDLFHTWTIPTVTDLDLSSNRITDQGVSRFLGTAWPRQLRRLILGGNAITDQGAIELAERWPRGNADQLKTLNLRFTITGQPGQQALLARFGGRVDLF